MPRGDPRLVRIERQSDNIVRVAEFALRLLFAPLLGLLTPSKDLLCARLRVQNDTQRRCHVDTLLLVVVVEVLARKITLVTVDKVNFVLLVGWIWVDGGQYVWLLDCTNPRLTGHKLVTVLRRVHIELVITGQAIVTLLSSLGTSWVNMLRFELASHFPDQLVLQTLELGHKRPLFILAFLGCGLSWSHRNP